MYKSGGGLFDFLGQTSSQGKKLNDRINKLLINIDYSEGKYTNNKNIENLIKWLTNLHELDTIINNPNINKNSSGTKVILDKIKVRNNKMGEIFVKAAQSNNEEYMGIIIAQLPSIVNYVGKNRVTALHIVARLGNTKFINLLLENGADINAKMAGNLTPLHQAVISGVESSIKALINAGANNSVVNERGHTARNLAQHGTVYNSVPSNFKKIRPLNTRRLPRAGVNENLNNNTRTVVSPRVGSFKRRRPSNNLSDNSKRMRANANSNRRPPLHPPLVRRNVSRGIASRNNRFKALENRFKALRGTTTVSANTSERIRKLTNRFKALRAPSSARRQLAPNINTRLNNAYNAVGIQRAHAPQLSNEELDAELANAAALNSSRSGGLSNKDQKEVNEEIANLEGRWNERKRRLERLSNL